MCLWFLISILFFSLISNLPLVYTKVFHWLSHLNDAHFLDNKLIEYFNFLQNVDNVWALAHKVHPWTSGEHLRILCKTAFWKNPTIIGIHPHNEKLPFNSTICPWLSYITVVYENMIFLCRFRLLQNCHLFLSKELSWILEAKQSKIQNLTGGSSKQLTILRFRLIVDCWRSHERRLLIVAAASPNPVARSPINMQSWLLIDQMTKEESLAA